MNCFECEAGGDIHMHHVVPKSLGGTKMVPLCERCHGLVHDVGMVGHTRLIRQGIEKTRSKGTRLGRPPGHTDSPDALMARYPDIIRCLDEGKSIRVTAKTTDRSTATVQKVKDTWKMWEV